MKHLKFLVGALGGAVGGYVLSNKTLRKKLTEAKDANEAAKILGKEIQKSGKGLAKDVKKWVESDDVQEKFDALKKYVSVTGDKLASEARKRSSTVARKARKNAASEYKKVKHVIEEKLHMR